MPTTRPRHTITETPPVQAALDDLRRELGEDRIELPDLVIRGARERLREVRAQHDDGQRRLDGLLEAMEAGAVKLDPVHAEEARGAWSP
ncbi:MAG TPA: hypothetical protein VHP56_00375 [Solirubrobacterales bacterium]|jgi:hypothetical protein|nr:hypothetical protein [Solirubrobacterales bacterium]